VATCVALVPSVTAAVFDPYSLGRVGVQLTLPDSPTDAIAPDEHALATRSWTWLEFTCFAPTAPLMILRPPTAPDLSFQLPTLPFWSWAFPTLLFGSVTAAYPTPPSETNNATNETTIGTDGRRRTSDFRRKVHTSKC